MRKSTITIDVTVEKGGGRDALLADIGVALVLADARIRPGDYVVTIERADQSSGADRPTEPAARSVSYHPKGDR